MCCTIQLSRQQLNPVMSRMKRFKCDRLLLKYKKTQVYFMYLRHAWLTASKGQTFHNQHSLHSTHTVRQTPAVWIRTIYHHTIMSYSQPPLKHGFRTEPCNCRMSRGLLSIIIMGTYLEISSCCLRKNKSSARMHFLSYFCSFTHKIPPASWIT